MIRFNRSKIIYPCTRNHFLSVLKLRFFLSTILQVCWRSSRNKVKENKFSGREIKKIETRKQFKRDSLSILFILYSTSGFFLFIFEYVNDALERRKYLFFSKLSSNFNFFFKEVTSRAKNFIRKIFIIRKGSFLFLFFFFY